LSILCGVGAGPGISVAAWPSGSTHPKPAARARKTPLDEALEWPPYRVSASYWNRLTDIR
jgi:hypothetical protein